MAGLLIKGGRWFDGQRLTPLDLRLSGDAVAETGLDLAPRGEQVLNAAGLVVCPGFVDLHVHLREPGFSHKETIATGTSSAAAGGFTTVCAMPNLNPVPDSAGHLQAQLDLIAHNARVRVLPFASITVGQRGQALSDIEALSPLCAGFSDDGKGVQQSELMREAMAQVRAAGSLISAHCEDESLLCGGSVHEGYARRHGMAGISSASEYRQIERDIALVRETGCRYHICHISAAESLDLVRQAKRQGLPVTSEVTPHHIALCEDDIDADDGRFKMNPPLRGATDRQAIWRALADGTIDCIATDHAPHTHEEKAKGLEGSAFGIVGLETAFAVCNTCLVRGGRLSLEALLALMTTGPRRVLDRVVDLGADLVVLDPDEAVTVDPEGFASLGRSTPFAGRSLFGAVKATICGGKLVYGIGA